MRVLELVAVRGKGGTGASVVNFVKEMSCAGVGVDVVCFRRSDVYKKLMDFSGVDVITGVKMPRKFKPLSFVRDILKLCKLVKERNYNIIHTHSSPDATLGLFLKILFPDVKLVRTRHVPVPFSSDIKHKFFDLIVVRSFCVLDSIKRLNSSHKVKVVYDGVAVKGRGGFQQKKHLTIGCVARYAKVKGLSFFLLYLTKVPFDFRAFVVGRTRKAEGTRRIDELKHLSKKLGLNERIVFMNYTESVERLYSSMDLATLTSIDSEGSSRVSMEAMAFGIPLVVSKVGALPEMVEDGKTGFVCFPADCKCFSHRYSLLLSNPKVSKIIGLNGKRRASLKFEIKKNVSYFLEFLS